MYITIVLLKTLQFSLNQDQVLILLPKTALNLLNAQDRPMFKLWQQDLLNLSTEGW